jgi:hypothetical protein
MLSNSTGTSAGTSLNDILNLTGSSSALPTTTGGGARGVFGAILGGVGNVLMPGLGTIIGGAIGGSALGGGVLGGQTSQYLALQQQITNESLAYELASNVIKTRYDVDSQVIENMKV